jgi:hypothetical protein
MMRLRLLEQARPIAHAPRGRWIIEANSGGPASRRRTESVRASVLRSDTDPEGPVRMPSMLRAGLHFAVYHEPLQRTLESLARLGHDDPEQLRERFRLPEEPLLVHVVPDAKWAVAVLVADDETILRHALLLGLCTAYQYDPARPVIWTRASLTRRVELHAPGRFYA